MLIGFIVVFLLSFLLDKIGFSYMSYILVAFGFIFLILFMFSDHWLSIKLSKSFQMLGEMSYTLYLVHFPVLLLVLAVYSKMTNNYKIENLLFFIVGAIVAVIVARVLYHLGEKQTQDYLSRTR